MKITSESLKQGVSPDELEETTEKKTGFKLKRSHKKDTDEDDTAKKPVIKIKRSEEPDNDDGDDDDEEEVGRSPKQTAIIIACIVLIIGIIGGGTYMFIDALSMNDTEKTSDTALSEEDKALLDNKDSDKTNEADKTDTKEDEKDKVDEDIEVETPDDSLSDAERIVKLQGEIDRLKSELETARKNEGTASEVTSQTPAPAVEESQTVKDLKKKISDLEGALSASEAREAYLQNQLSAAKNSNSK